MAGKTVRYTAEFREKPPPATEGGRGRRTYPETTASFVCGYLLYRQARSLMNAVQITGGTDLQQFGDCGQTRLRSHVAAHP